MSRSVPRRLAWLAAGLLLGLLPILTFEELPNGLRWPVRLLSPLLLGVGLARSLGPVVRWIGAPLRLGNGRLDPVLLLLLAVVTVLCGWNSTHHDLRIHYDSKPHREVMEVYAEGRIPLEEDTRGFHYAPLGYVVGIAVLRADGGHNEARRAIQLANVVWALATAWAVILLARFLRPESDWTPRFALLLLAILPAFYKTFAMPRPEPMLTALVIWNAWFGCRLLVRARADDWRPASWGTAAGFGLTMGAMLLCRQWGAFVLPAYGVIWALALLRFGWTRFVPLLLRTAVAAVLAVLVAGWFYLAMTQLHGTPLTFNRERENLPDRHNREFLLGHGDGLLFRSPVHRDGPDADHLVRQFPNQLGPILYSETWGDYWGVWQGRPHHWDRFDDEGRELPHNHPEAIARLVRANWFGLLPTAVLIAGLLGAGGLLLDLRRDDGIERPSLAHWLVVASPLGTLAGYFWFLFSYPNGIGDTIKATYCFQVYPLLAVLGGALLARLLPAKAGSVVGWVIFSLLAATGLALGPVMVTRIVDQRGIELLEPLGEGTAPVLLLVAPVIALLVALGGWLASRRRTRRIAGSEEQAID